MDARSHIFNWINGLPANGRYTFTREEAEEVSGASFVAVQSALRRLKQKGVIVSPRRGFHVIVPPEYRDMGSPPASWFIDNLMRFCKCKYYVGLLTAAALHGASHQKPMVFQVLTDRLSVRMKAGRTAIQTRRSRSVGRFPIQRIQTETGTMAVSTPEATSLDLIRFPGASGGWNNIGTVLIELAVQIDPVRLVDTARLGRLSDVQRLGYLLELLQKVRLSEPIAEWLATRRTTTVPLRTDRPTNNFVADPHWRVIPNEEVEPDL